MTRELRLRIGIESNYKKLKNKNKITKDIEKNNYIKISSPSDFSKIIDLDANYELVSDIDMEGFNFEVFWSRLEKIRIRDNKTLHFNGTFNGNGYTLKNITLEEISGLKEHFGFFPVIGPNGKFINTHIQNIKAKGLKKIGFICARNFGLISNIIISGDIETITETGGITYYNDTTGIISDIYADLNINSITKIGGIAHINHGQIKNVFTNGSIVGKSNIGGIVYENYGTISDSESSVKILGRDKIGGIASLNKEVIRNTKFEGSIIASNYIGGIAYYNDKLLEKVETENVSILALENVGGVVAINTGEVEKSSFDGKITADEFIGGVCSANYGVISNSYATGQINGVDYLGGICSRNSYHYKAYDYGKIKYSYSNIEFINRKNIIKNEPLKSHLASLLGSDEERIPLKDYSELPEDMFNGIYFIKPIEEGLKENNITELTGRMLPSGFDKKIWRIKKGLPVLK